MSYSSPEGIVLGKGSKLVSAELSINKESVFSIKQEKLYIEEEARDAYNASQERSYSEEEVKELLKSYRNSIVEVNPVDIIYLDKWFEKFKK